MRCANSAGWGKTQAEIDLLFVKRSQTDVHAVLQVSIKKPLGFTLSRGNDGGTYVSRTDGDGNTDDKIKVS